MAKANDALINGNASMLTNKRNAGASFFVSRRLKQAYDHNGDNFSEMPGIKGKLVRLPIFFITLPQTRNWKSTLQV